MVAADMPTRRAALLLHAQPEETRQEILKRLDAKESAVLRPLLDELQQLGIPASLAKLGQFASSVQTPKPPAADAFAKLHQLSAEEIAPALHSCAALTIVQLLGARQWPWQQSVIERIPEPKRSEVRRCLQRKPALLMPASMAVLVENLSLEIERHQSTPRVAPAYAPTIEPRRQSGLLRAFKRWTTWTR